MSRLDQQVETQYTQEGFTEKYVKNCPKERDETERVLLIDADSLLYMCSYKLSDPYLDENEEEVFRTEEEELEEGKYRINNKIQEITNNVEEWYNIKTAYYLLSGSSNFRYKLYPEYKSNRKNIEKPKWFKELKEYCLTLSNFILCNGKEADDLTYELYLLSNKQCVISCIDKDVLMNCPECPIYDYRAYNDVIGEFKYITLEESRLKIARQIVEGDNVDFVKGAKSVGKAWCDKNMWEGMTDYQFIKAIYKAYMKANKENSELAKADIRLNYSVLKLYKQKEINELNLVD